MQLAGIGGGLALAARHVPCYDALAQHVKEALQPYVVEAAALCEGGSAAVCAGGCSAAVKPWVGVVPCGWFCGASQHAGGCRPMEIVTVCDGFVASQHAGLCACGPTSATRCSTTAGSVNSSARPAGAMCVAERGSSPTAAPQPVPSGCARWSRAAGRAAAWSKCPPWQHGARAWLLRLRRARLVAQCNAARHSQLRGRRVESQPLRMVLPAAAALDPLQLAAARGAAVLTRGGSLDILWTVSQSVTTALPGLSGLARETRMVCWTLSWTALGPFGPTAWPWSHLYPPRPEHRFRVL